MLNGVGKEPTLLSAPDFSFNRKVFRKPRLSTLTRRITPVTAEVSALQLKEYPE
jgi:hypothetical protein